MDYANVVTAAISQDAQRGWWRRLKPSEISIDLGKIVGTIAKTVGLDAPELKAKWDLNLQNRVASETALAQAKKEELFAAAVRIQNQNLKRHYCHNIDHGQVLSSSERDLLCCRKRDALPLSQSSLKHGDLVVVDTLLVIDQEHIYAADYPSFISKAADTRILLRTDNSVRTLLLGHPAFKMKWNPYCRILARYLSLGESQPLLELLLLSARSFGRLDRESALETAKEVKELTSQYSQELDRSSVALTLQIHVAARSTEGADVSDQEGLIRRNRYGIFRHDFEHEKLEKIRKFEDDIFAGPYAFWLGLSYFLNTYGDGPNAINAGEIIHELSFWTRYFRAEEWRTSLPYLKGLDIIRFDDDALDRFLPPDLRR
jgi:hypothetical protein